MIHDTELLRQYAEDHTEAAFAELVQRHVNVVYAAALRRVGGDAHLAEEVTQRVFTILAQKARSLKRHPALIGWLHRSTHYAALDAMRRKLRREQRLQAMEIMNASQEANRNRNGEVDWNEVRPVIDSLLDQLNERDRGALLLRFFEGHSFPQIGAALRLSEDAARMRVDRALDRLRAALARRGITSSTAALGVALANTASANLPARVVANVTSAALAGATGGYGAFVAFLTMSKIKVGIVGAVAAAMAATGVVELRANRELRVELNALRAGDADPVRLRRETQQLDIALAKLAANNPERDELLWLRNRAGVLKARPAGVIDAEFKPATTWRNVGRATLEAANETFHWALLSRDVDQVAHFIVFSDDTESNRRAFMSHFSETVRAKYQTPERLVAATIFGVGESAGPSAAWRPDDAFQIIGSDDHVGGDGTRFGQARLRVWYRTAAGEREGSDRWQSTPDGWVMGAFALTPGARQSDDALTHVLSRINPTTGEFLPIKK